MEELSYDEFSWTEDGKEKTAKPADDKKKAAAGEKDPTPVKEKETKKK